MKTTSILLAAALVTPAALAFGISAAVVSTTAIGVGLSAIALGDYAKPICSYRTDTVVATRTEHHPLAA